MPSLPFPFEKQADIEQLALENREAVDVEHTTLGLVDPVHVRRAYSPCRRSGKALSPTTGRRV